LGLGLVARIVTSKVFAGEEMVLGVLLWVGLFWLCTTEGGSVRGGVVGGEGGFGVGITLFAPTSSLFFFSVI
jgi:hypothetical protein